MCRDFLILFGPSGWHKSLTVIPTCIIIPSQQMASQPWVRATATAKVSLVNGNTVACPINVPPLTVITAPRTEANLARQMNARVTNQRATGHPTI